MKFLSDILAKAGLTVDGVVTLNNTATGQTPAANDNSTKLATTAWVRGFVTPYSLPIASGLTLGGIKIGSGLAIDGTGIVSVAATGVGAIRALQQFTATAGQTVFTVSGGYTPGLIDVFLNGVLLTPTSITASNGTTFTLSDAALVNDVLDVFVYNPIYGGFISSTDQVPEGATNLYFTNARARAAISLTTTGSSGAATYNSSTGVLNIPSYIGGVVSIFGRTGTVVAVSGDYTTALVTEVTNLYYTDARARAAISVTGSGSYDSATGIITVTGGVTSVNTLTGAVTLTTTNIAEGTNLYYTDARVGTYLTTNSYATQTYVGTQIANLVASAPATLDTLNELATALGNDPSFATTVATSIGTKVPQTRTITINGTGYDLSADRSWTIASGVTSFNTRTGAITSANGDYTTAQVTESGNLYYTDTRVRAAISLTTTGTSGAATYDSATGIFNIPQYQGGVTSFNTRTGAISLTSSDVTTALTYTPVTNARTLTINGTAYDLTADRTWTIGVSPSARTIQTYTATAAQTTFTVTGGYVVGLVDVFINGVRLTSADFTATNGTTVVLTTGTGVNNIVDVIKYTSAFTASSALRQVTYFTATAGQTSFTVSYTPGLVDVYYNGSKLASSEYTATNGTSIVLATAAVLNDAIEVVAYSYAVGAYTGQAQLNGTGFVKVNGTTVSYDNSTYLTSVDASSAYIPYTGATGYVNLGTNDISAGHFNATGDGGGGVLNLFKASSRTVGGSDAANTISIWADGTAIGFNDWVAGNTRSAKFSVASITNNATVTLTIPNASGTIALTSNLSSYLPLSGGTLTGALSGTSATFSGQVGIGGGTSVNYNLKVTGNTYLLGASSGTSDYALVVQNSSANNLFLVRNDGQATFSSSLIAPNLTIGNLSSGSDAVLNLANNASGSPRSIIYRAATAFIDITNTAGAAVFQLSNAGAATFNGSVTANGIITPAGYSITSGDAISASGNLILNTGANRYVQIGSATNYYWRFRAFNDDLELNGGSNAFTAVKFYYPTGAAVFNSSIAATNIVLGSGTINSIPSWMKVITTGTGDSALGAVYNNKAIYVYNNGSALKIDAYDYATSTALDFQVGGNGGSVTIAPSGGNVLIGTTTNGGPKIAAEGQASGWGYTFYNTSGGASVKTYISHGGAYGMAIDSSMNTAGVYLLKLASGDGTNRGTVEQFKVTGTGNVLIGGGSDAQVWMNRGLKIEGSRPSIDLVNNGGGTLNTMRWYGGTAGKELHMNFDTSTSIWALRFNSYYLSGGAASHEFFGNGNFTIAGTLTESSSIRYKENIETVKNGLDVVLQLRGVTYNKKETGVEELGLIAEEVNDILPNVVIKNDKGQPDSVSYGRIVAVLIEAVKELKQEINIINGKLNS